MSWITLSTDDVKRSLTGAEFTALQTAALSSGQSDPFTAILAEVIKEVRGYVAACSENSLGDGLTIPEELKSATLARVRFEAFTRLPLGRSLLTEDRVEANKAAERLFARVAACTFKLEQPTTVSAAVIGGGSVSVISSSPRRAKPSHLAGL